MSQQSIQNQVKLPTRIALGVVLQGIRIRFGRSLVTISGVALGVAFLMSIFSGQVITGGVSEEQNLRNEVSRMYGFLIADTGPLLNQTVSVVQVGPLNQREQRLVRRISNESPKTITWSTDGDASIPDNLNFVQQTELGQIPGDTLCVLVMGQAAESRPLVLNEIMMGKLVIATRTTLQNQLASHTAMPRPVVSLDRQLRPEEIARVEAELKRQGFRRVWIIIISLLVTIIGISNAMLMSVTERFREIGTMKCLGALSGFIRRMFLIESSLMGLVGSLVGVLAGLLLPVIAYGFIYGFVMVLTSMNWLHIIVYMIVGVVVGLALSVIAALYPAHYASKMLPAAALRSNI